MEKFHWKEEEEEMIAIFIMRSRHNDRCRPETPVDLPVGSITGTLETLVQ